MAKHFFRVEMTVEASALHAVTSAATGKATDVSIRPVIGKAAQANGADRKPRSWIWSWLAQRKTFTAAEAIAYGDAQNAKRNATYGALADAVNRKLIKRTSPGAYQILPGLKAEIAKQQKGKVGA